MKNVKYLILELVPNFFRTRWPLRKYYWQKEDLEEAEKKAKEMSELLKDYSK